ncbi:hypothetical protein HJG60_009063 [Phyllostomus discolor]|uniref:Uncharacterized protein n=1 Tax=Phyllostomus discolor TaxID=89673 RepID=A0A833YM52_9CHIR|nr:hypothetical protein HJG60_009063 [Phyllostomus discolor]
MHKADHQAKLRSGQTQSPQNRPFLPSRAPSAQTRAGADPPAAGPLRTPGPVVFQTDFPPGAQAPESPMGYRQRHSWTPEVQAVGVTLGHYVTTPTSPDPEPHRQQRLGLPVQPTEIKIALGTRDSLFLHQQPCAKFSEAKASPRTMWSSSCSL